MLRKTWITVSTSLDEEDPFAPDEDPAMGIKILMPPKDHDVWEAIHRFISEAQELHKYIHHTMTWKWTPNSPDSKLGTLVWAVALYTEPVNMIENVIGFMLDSPDIAIRGDGDAMIDIRHGLNRMLRHGT